MVRHHKHILLVGINGINALVFIRTIFLSTIFRIEVRLSIKKNMDSHNNLLSFVIGHYKHILLIMINDFDALVLEEKHHFLPFLELKFVFQLG